MRLWCRWRCYQWQWSYNQPWQKLWERNLDMRESDVIWFQLCNRFWIQHGRWWTWYELEIELRYIVSWTQTRHLARIRDESDETIYPRLKADWRIFEMPGPYRLPIMVSQSSWTNKLLMTTANWDEVG